MGERFSPVALSTRRSPRLTVDLRVIDAVGDGVILYILSNTLSNASTTVRPQMIGKTETLSIFILLFDEVSVGTVTPTDQS